MKDAQPQHGDFRSALQSELIRRCKANPKYSLRAFARQLGVESSALSRILTGKRAVTPKTFAKLAARLGLSPEEWRRLAPGRLRRGRGGSPIASTDTAPASVLHYESISPELFEVTADWHHYAILELIAVRGFRSDPRWIASALGITRSEVNIAVERMRKLGLLEIDDQGRWHDRAERVTTVDHPLTSVAHRKHQRQVLEGAIAALETYTLEERDQSAVTVAINSALLPEAKKRIKKFRRELCAFLRSQGPLDQVFQLTTSLYPISKKEKSK